MLADIAALDASEFWFWLIAVTVGGIASLAGSLWAWSRARILADTPTSRIRSASQGYVELQGTAELMNGPPIIAPLSLLPCVWWQFRVDKKETRVRKGRTETTWRTIRRGRSDSLFLLRDDTGVCIVDPEAARVVSHHKDSWRGHLPMPGGIRPSGGLLRGDYRYTEYRLISGDPLYAIGHFRTDGQHHDFDENAAVRELLRDWKRDENALLERFDTDDSGDIDLSEWEAVRAAAIDQVRQQFAARAADPDIHVLSRPPDRRPYILSNTGQARLTRGYHWRAGLLFAVFLLLSGALAVLLTGRGLLA